MDDDELRKLPEEDVLEDLDDVEDLDDDPLADGIKKKGKKLEDGDDSLDALAEDEDGILPGDAFDDVEPEDLW